MRRFVSRRLPLVVLMGAVGCALTAVAVVGSGVVSASQAGDRSLPGAAAAGARGSSGYGATSAAGRGRRGSLSSLSTPLTLLLRGSHGKSSMSLSVNRSLAAAPPSQPSGPPGNPSARVTEINTQGHPTTATSLGQQRSTAWAVQTSGTSVTLNATDAIDNTHVWAAGANCTLLLTANGGTSWTKDLNVTGCPGGTNLTGVFVQSGSGPGWAVGSGGTVLVCASGCNVATAAWGPLAPGSVAGTNDGKLTNASTAAQSNSLFATTAYVGWAITASSGKIPANTTVVSVNTSTKTATLSNAATAATTKDTFTVTAPASVLPPAAINFTAVWAADANHVYAVGTTGGGAGKVWACSSSCSSTGVGTGNALWSDITPAGLGSTSLNSVEGQGSSLVYAAGSSSTILVCTGNTCATASSGWTPLGAGTIPGSNDGTLTSGSPSAVSNSLFTQDYSGYRITDSAGKIPANTTVASVNTSTKTATLSNNATASATKDTFTVTAPPLPSGLTFNSIWAVDANHVYAVGTGSAGAGVIWACSSHCDQSTFGPAQVPSPPASGPSPPGSTAAWANIAPSFPLPALRSVTGTGPDNAWAVGANGAIWFCPYACTTEPTSWVQLSPSYPTTSTLNGVALTDANHVWAVGQGGTIVTMQNPSDTAKSIASAIGELGTALNATIWSTTNLDGNHVDPSQGGLVFDNTKSAVADLKGLKPTPPAWAVTDMTYLDYAARLIASVAIADNSCSPQNTKELGAANDELANGDQEFTNAHYDAAVDHYKKAWEHAIKANGSTCAITVSPSGAPAFSVTNMVPGDVRTISGVAVTVVGSVSPLTGIYETNVVSTACTGCPPGVGTATDLAHVLQLRIVDTTTGLTVYSTAPLDGLSSSASSPQVICAIGSTSSTGPGCIQQWAANETHTFTFTVTLPFGVGNAYARTGASLNFVWERSA